jgi:hypothetical protein
MEAVKIYVEHYQEANGTKSDPKPLNLLLDNREQLEKLRKTLSELSKHEIFFKYKEITPCPSSQNP